MRPRKKFSDMSPVEKLHAIEWEIKEAKARYKFELAGLEQARSKYIDEAQRELTRLQVALGAAG